MNRFEALDALATRRVAHLATVRPEGRPHIVPVTFALTTDWVVTMIDQKPKTTTRLQRLVNIETRPVATLLADRYSEDWSSLWWVRIDGSAAIHEEGHSWEVARSALIDKYDQYRLQPPVGPAILISVDLVTSWESTP